MEFIEALKEIVNAIPAFRDETTLHEVLRALDVEDDRRTDESASHDAVFESDDPDSELTDTDKRAISRPGFGA